MADEFTPQELKFLKRIDAREDDKNKRLRFYLVGLVLLGIIAMGYYRASQLKSAPLSDFYPPLSHYSSDSFDQYILLSLLLYFIYYKWLTTNIIRKLQQKIKETEG